MRILARYSHLNGEEYLLVHRRKLWDEAQAVIAEVTPLRAGRRFQRKDDARQNVVSPGERDLLNVVRQGRGVPAVPLVLVGVAP